MKTKILGVLATLLLTPPLANADGVIVGDREWRQLTDTINLAWSDVAAVCNLSTGACNGSVGAVSFDGWTLASIEDVQQLFEQLIKPESVQFPTFDTFESNYLAVDDPDIQAALGPGGFAPLPTTFGPVRTGGFTRSPFVPVIPGYNFAPYLLLDATEAGEDFACLYCAGDTAEGPQNYRGSWMYRAATPAQLVDNLATIVVGIGPGVSFSAKIAMIQSYLESGDLAAACAESEALLNQVSAQAGKRMLSDADAVRIATQINVLRESIGCS